MGVKLLWYLLRLRIRLPISNWNFSSFVTRIFVSIHVSHPYGRVGMTNISNTLLLVRGFVLP